jgi:uncharacterized protein YegP (UPF0339 family)
MITKATSRRIAMPAKIQIKRRDAGGFQFVLVGQNGRTIATSEPYASKASCVNGINALQRAATSAQVEDQTTKEWAARQSAAPPAVTKAARTVGKAVGKAKAKVEKAVAPPPPAPSREPRRPRPPRRATKKS